jgi:hypothetical protein
MIGAGCPVLPLRTGAGGLLRKVLFGVVEAENSFSTAQMTSSRCAKYRLCSYRRRVSFHTRSMGFSSGL